VRGSELTGQRFWEEMGRVWRWAEGVKRVDRLNEIEKKTWVKNRECRICLIGHHLGLDVERKSPLEEEGEERWSRSRKRDCAR